MLFGSKNTSEFSKNSENRLSQYFSALSDTRRLEILKLLMTRSDLSVSQIGGVFRITPSAASQQLKYLEMVGLIRRIRVGQKICYQIREDDGLVRELLKIVSNS